MLHCNRTRTIATFVDVTFIALSPPRQFVTKRSATSKVRYGTMLAVEVGPLPKHSGSGEARRAECAMKKTRLFELLALGPELIAEAKREGKSVNESYYLVHRVIAQALTDPSRLPRENLRDHLSSRMKQLAAA
jgi:hypothetical protein